MTMKKSLIIFLRCIPMLIVMAVIFNFSSSDGEESGSLSLEIAKAFSRGLSYVRLDVSPQTLHLPIRKMAHMTEYAILAMTVMLAIGRVKHRVVFAILISVLYAASDELHQTFVSMRCGTVYDVLIDSVGVLIGIAVYLIINHRLHKEVKGK